MAYFPERIAAERGADTALVDERGSTTWSEFNQRINQLVHALRAIGATAGDVIAICAGNCRENYEIMMAANHAGLLYVPVNWHFSAEELAYVMADAGAKVLFAEGQFMESAAEAAADTPTLAACVAIRGDGAPEAFQDF